MDGLEPAAGDRVFRKSRHDGFYGTGLEHALHAAFRQASWLFRATLVHAEGIAYRCPPGPGPA